MGKALSEKQIRQYHDQGFLCPMESLTGVEAARCKSLLEDYEKDTGGAIAGNLRFNSHLLFPWLAELVRQPRILDAVEDVLGPDLLCWSTTFFIKEAASANYVSWHQDNTYAHLSEADNLTVWLGFTDCTRDNGCMLVVPGSHQAQLPHHDTDAKGNLLSRGQTLSGPIDADSALPMELKAGEFSLHHSLLFHSSGPNSSPRRRIGFTIRYIPAHQKSRTGIVNYVLPVRGKDRHGNFEHAPWPTVTMDPAMLALHAEANDRHSRILLEGSKKTAF